MAWLLNIIQVRGDLGTLRHGEHWDKDHIKASWYRQPCGTSEEFQLLRDQLDHIRNQHKCKKKKKKKKKLPSHISNTCTKANRTLGFLRRNLYVCLQEVKEAAYKVLVRPVLEYSGSV